MLDTFNAVWTALTTTNEELIKVILIPCNFVEVTITMLLFTTLLNIDCTKKQKFIYVISLSVFGIINSYAQEKIELEEVKIQANRKLNNSVKYEKLNKMPDFGVYSFGTAIEDGKLYIMSGDVSNTGLRTEYKGFSDKIYVYDLEKDFWRTLKTKTSTIASNSIISHNGSLYNFGGRRFGNNRNRELLNNKIDVYDIKKDTVIVDNVMMHQAVNSAVVKVDDKILFFGGSTKKYHNNTKFLTNKVSMYNLTTGYWYEMDPMPTAKETQGILVDNKIYLIGGNINKPLDTVETYNLQDGKFTTELKLPIPMTKPSLAKKDHIIYIYTNGVFYTYDTYNKTLKEYTINNISSHNGQIFIYNDFMYLLGGSIGIDTPTDEMYKFSLSEFNNTKVKRELKIKYNSN